MGTFLKGLGSFCYMGFISLRALLEDSGVESGFEISAHKASIGLDMALCGVPLSRLCLP